jgi:hypothetical protein
MKVCEKHDAVVVIDDMWAKCPLCEAEQKVEQLADEITDLKDQIKGLEKDLEEAQQ